MLDGMARSLAHGHDASAKCEEDGAAAHDGHDAPGNEVVDAHEVSGLGLDHSLLDATELVVGPGVIGSLVTITSGELTDSVEPPDDSGDPPGQATAASGAASEASEARTEGWDADRGDSGKAHSAGEDEALDETPEEPLDEVVVDGHGSVIPLSSNLQSKAGSLDCPDVGGIRVVEGVLTKINHESDSTSAAGKTDKAGTELGASTAGL